MPFKSVGLRINFEMIVSLLNRRSRMSLLVTAVTIREEVGHRVVIFLPRRKGPSRGVEKLLLYHRTLVCEILQGTTLSPVLWNVKLLKDVTKLGELSSGWL